MITIAVDWWTEYSAEFSCKEVVNNLCPKFTRNKSHNGSQPLEYPCCNDHTRC